jgi:hypothetical protein
LWWGFDSILLFSLANDRTKMWCIIRLSYYNAILLKLYCCKGGWIIESHHMVMQFLILPFHLKFLPLPIKLLSDIYILKKVVCLFCLSHWDFPNHNIRPITCLILFERSWWVGVHQGGFIIFRPMVWESFNIEQVFQRKFNKI